MHEVHRPDFQGRYRFLAITDQFRPDLPFRVLVAQLQAQLVVKPSNRSEGLRGLRPQSLYTLVHKPALPSQHDVDAPVAIPNTVRHPARSGGAGWLTADVFDALSQRGLIGSPRSVVEGGRVEQKIATGTPYRHAPFRNVQREITV